MWIRYFVLRCKIHDKNQKKILHKITRKCWDVIRCITIFIVPLILTNSGLGLDNLSPRASSAFDFSGSTPHCISYSALSINNSDHAKVTNILDFANSLDF
jgi:hypothetical protein